jgi:hypothetical protein
VKRPYRPSRLLVKKKIHQPDLTGERIELVYETKLMRRMRPDRAIMDIAVEFRLFEGRARFEARGVAALVVLAIRRQ